MLRLIAKVIALGLLGLLALAVFFYIKIASPLVLKSERIEFEIPLNSSFRSAAKGIVEAGVDIDPRLLIILGKLQRVDDSIKAGSYELHRGATALDLLSKISRGDVVRTEIVFIEGWTFRQFRERLYAHPDLRHETKGLSDAEIMRLLGSAHKNAEGLFFPDTYRFARNSRDIDVLARAYRLMQRHLEREWQNRAPDLPYTDSYQALIMASIIEKETGRDQDRPMVASVFVNRLRIGMLLQADPTVIYGMGDSFDGNLRRRDLLTDTPFNTYTRRGLPPTPIAMPGLASIRAAMHPAQSEALYFVARGDGTSHFSNTLAEHNRAVNRYQRGGR